MAGIGSKIFNGVANTLIKGRRARAGVFGVRQEKISLRHHQALLVEPRTKTEVGGNLVKENWLVQNKADPDHFNHYLAHIHHPRNADKGLPVVLLLPGMLCNGNYFRISPREKNFRDLNSHYSFANYLAFKGFHVVLANPRFCQWIYARYVRDQLGVKNYFSNATDFPRLVGDLSFYLDVALHLTGRASAAVGGFSMGGMVEMYYLATARVDPRVSHALFMAAPSRFSGERTLLRVLQIYGTVARYLPLQEYNAASLLADNVPLLKKLMVKLPPEVLSALPMAKDLFNPKEINPETILPFIRYVLEPMPSPVINYLLNIASRGEFLDQAGSVNIPAKLSRCKVPALVIGGDRDGLVSGASNKTLFEAIGSKIKERRTMRGAGHLDLVAGRAFEETAEIVTHFIKKH